MKDSNYCYYSVYTVWKPIKKGKKTRYFPIQLCNECPVKGKNDVLKQLLARIFLLIFFF